MPACSDYVFAIGPDGQLFNSNKPLHHLFPAAAADPYDPAKLAPRQLKRSNSSRRLSAEFGWMVDRSLGGADVFRDVLHVLHGGPSVSREGISLGPACKPIPVAYRVCPMLAPRSELSEFDISTLELEEIEGLMTSEKRYEPSAGDEVTGAVVVLQELEAQMPEMLHQTRQECALMRQLIASMLPALPASGREAQTAGRVMEHLESMHGGDKSTQQKLLALCNNILQCTDAGGGSKPAKTREEIFAEMEPLLLPPMHNEGHPSTPTGSSRGEDDTPSLSALALELRSPSSRDIHFPAVEAPLLEWSLDFREDPHDADQLLLPTCKMLHFCCGVGGFGVAPRDLLRFVSMLRDSYLPNPFHSYRHGLMVMHKSFLIAVKSSLHRYTSRLDLFALLLAAAGHDVGHLGRSNAYEMASESPLALLYNNRSVLESHHCATLFKLFNQYGMLDGLSRPQRAYVRQIIIDAITTTDMAHHNALHGNLKGLVDEKLPLLDAAARVQKAQAAEGGAAAAAAGPADKKSREAAAELTRSRSVLLQCVVHAADLCTPTLPFQKSLGWVQALGTEFRDQVELERQKGLPLSDALAPADLQVRPPLKAPAVVYPKPWLHSLSFPPVRVSPSWSWALWAGSSRPSGRASPWRCPSSRPSPRW